MADPIPAPRGPLPGASRNPFPFPPNATWGFLIGSVVGVLLGMAIGAAWLDYGDRWVVLVAAPMTAWGGAGGAVIGATKDILSLLRPKDTAQHAAEADYRELDPPPGQP